MQFVSTAGYPHGDIHKMFENSDQKYWTTFCERCGYEQVLALDFPECIAEHPAHSPRAGQVYYMCKKCRGEIVDTQRGAYVPHGDPHHEVSGYHVSQLISSLRSPREVIQAYRDSDNMKEFYNAELGLPFVDEVNKPVSLEMLDGNINPLLEWGDGFTGKNFMGVDQMSGNNYVFILNKEPISQKVRVVWFEIIDDPDPFKRTGQLMEEFNVKLCVCDSEPNANDALRFAGHFGKRVFLCKYGRYDDMTKWQDQWKPKKWAKRAGTETYHKWRVFLDKYKCIERTLKWIAGGRVEWPKPEAHLQEAFPVKGGARQQMPILRTHAYPHFACAVKERIEEDAEFSKYKYKWHFISYDPHSLCALDYAITATTRKGGGALLGGL